MTTINETPYLTTNDRTERTINEVPYLVTGGGGGGTSDYSQLSNKPKINGVELAGNKSYADLDLQKGIPTITVTASMVIGQDPVKIQGDAEMDAILTDPTYPFVMLDATAVGLGATVFSKAQMRNAGYWLLVQGAANFQTDTQQVAEETFQTVIYNHATKIGVYEETVVLDRRDIVNNLNNTSTEKALSANMGKELGTQITNLKNIGRFCAIWDASAGSPTSEPVETPYLYKTGDYFRIGVEGNKVPTGSQYNPGEYDLAEEDTGIGDVWYYDGLEWVKQVSSGGGTVQDVQINGASILNGGVANIPYASSSNAGVIRTSATTGTGADGNGVLTSYTRDYAQYQTDPNAILIGKGTLENVITGKGLVSSQEATKLKVLTQAEYDALATKDSATLYFIKEA